MVKLRPRDVQVNGRSERQALPDSWWPRPAPPIPEPPRSVLSGRDGSRKLLLPARVEHLILHVLCQIPSVRTRLVWDGPQRERADAADFTGRPRRSGGFAL